jgi:aryl-alcohol dehydrogenase-like predicted oxidoreductase
LQQATSCGGFFCVRDLAAKKVIRHSSVDLDTYSVSRKKAFYAGCICISSSFIHSLCFSKEQPMSFPTRALGTSALQVSPLCFGGNVLGWTADSATSFSLLDAWLGAGMNFVDTADVYSRWVPGHRGGESETVIGQWLKKSGKRKQLVLATKLGKDMGDGKVGLHPKYIKQAVDASLQRLQTDYIDLYQTHDDDPQIPFEDVLGTLGDLIQAGKVRAIGASNYSAQRLAKALDCSQRHGLARFDSLQPLYNLYDRAVFEKELQPLCVEHGVGVISFYALASGFLTGKYRSLADAAQSQRGDKACTYLTPRGLRSLDTQDQVAAQHSAQPGEVALAWLLHQPGITAPIASATSLAQLQSLINAATLQLDAAALALLDEVSHEG